MKYIQNNYKFILFAIFIIILFSIKFPYYIDAPGGISNMEDKIDIEGYNSKGSLNITYVREYRATLPTLLISLFNKNWDIIKEEDVLLEEETIKEYELRDKLFMNESISNAILVAYKKAGKEIKIKESDTTVLYISKDAKTNLELGDIILEINNTKINSKQAVTDIINKYNIGDRLNIKVKNKNKEYNRYAKVIELDKEKKLGIILVTINKYKTNPSIKINIESNESGSSGGLIMALSIYNKLTKQDITKGFTIVGTGTIDEEGNIGTIGGVKYKLKNAEAKKADLFLVPKGDNYKEAMKIKEEKNYKIKIVPVETFDDIVNYLENM